MLLGMAAVVLLVACLNLANMLLARGTARRKEIAIRLALGGSRWRIVRQLLTEGLLLALLGGAAGLLVGLWASKILRFVDAQISSRSTWSGMPGPICRFSRMTFAFCLLGTVAFALGPALKLSRNSVIGDLKEHAGDDVVRRRWRFLPRNPLVVVQIAFSLALLTAAALFIRGANKAAYLDTGLHVDNDLLLEVDASLGGFEPQRTEQLYRTLERSTRRVARCAACQHLGDGAVWDGLARYVPCSAPACTWVKMTSLATAAEGLAFSSRFNSVGADYFAAMGIPILRGRSFTVAEATQANQPGRRDHRRSARQKTLAGRRRARSADPDCIATLRRGRSATMAAAGWEYPADGKGNIKPEEPIEVVGIAANTRGDVFEKQPRGTIYVPFARGFQNNAFFFIQFSSLNKATVPNMADAVRRAARETDPTLPVLSLKTFPQHLESNMRNVDHPHRRDSFLRLRRLGAGARDCRRLWRESLLGRAADA